MKILKGDQLSPEIILPLMDRGDLLNFLRDENNVLIRGKQGYRNAIRFARRRFEI